MFAVLPWMILSTESLGIFEIHTVSCARNTHSASFRGTPITGSELTICQPRTAITRPLGHLFFATA